MADFLLKAIPLPLPRPAALTPDKIIQEPVSIEPLKELPSPVPDLFPTPIETNVSATDRIYNPVTEQFDIYSHKSIGLDYWKGIYETTLNYPYQFYSEFNTWLGKDISENTVWDIPYGVIAIVGVFGLFTGSIVVSQFLYEKGIIPIGKKLWKI